MKTDHNCLALAVCFASILSSIGQAAPPGILTDVVGVGGQEFRFGQLSAPIWEGARIDDQGPSVTGDGLTLFYASKAPGGSGNLDLWKVTRPALSSPWGAPVNLGPTNTTSGAELSDPAPAPDGRRLYRALSH